MGESAPPQILQKLTSQDTLKSNELTQFVLKLWGHRASGGFAIERSSLHKEDIAVERKWYCEIPHLEAVYSAI